MFKAGESFWGMTTYFNPAGYKTKFANYKIFRAGALSQGCRLLTVELAFGSRPFELKKNDADILIQLRTEDKNILWHKEALLNIGLGNLPKDCDKIAWLDCDIIFDQGDWVREACEKLNSCRVVQLFSSIILLEHAHRTSIPDIDKHQGFVYSHVNGMARSGQAGYAWAARRSILTGFGFFDRNIMGGGDTVFKDACYGIETHYLAAAFPVKLLTLQRQWRRKLNGVIKSQVGCLDGEIRHLSHGKIADRQYRARQAVLKDHDYDPVKDVRLDGNGILVWATDKPQLHQAVKDYFFSRHEDGAGS